MSLERVSSRRYPCQASREETQQPVQIAIAELTTVTAHRIAELTASDPTACDRKLVQATMLCRMISCDLQADRHSRPLNQKQTTLVLLPIDLQFRGKQTSVEQSTLLVNPVGPC